MTKILFPHAIEKIEDMIQFTNTYIENTKTLKQQLEQHFTNNTTTTLITKRLDLANDTFTTTTYTGKIKSIDANLCVMQIDYSGIAPGKTIFNREKTFRFDSFLGEIPVLSEDDIPCENKMNFNKEYATFLDQVKLFLAGYVGTKEKKKLNFIYTNLFVPGVQSYHFNAEVQEINASNIKVNIAYSLARFENKENCIYNSIPRTSIRPFVTPTTMLIGIAA